MNSKNCLQREEVQSVPYWRRTELVCVNNHHTSCPHRLSTCIQKIFDFISKQTNVAAIQCKLSVSIEISYCAQWIHNAFVKVAFNRCEIFHKNNTAAVVVVVGDTVACRAKEKNNCRLNQNLYTLRKNVWPTQSQHFYVHSNARTNFMCRYATTRLTEFEIWIIYFCFFFSFCLIHVSHVLFCMLHAIESFEWIKNKISFFSRLNF